MSSTNDYFLNPVFRYPMEQFSMDDDTNAVVTSDGMRV